MFNSLKTLILLFILNALFIVVGRAVAGGSGTIIALAIALLFNFGVYFYSEKIAIASFGAVPLTEEEYPEVFGIVTELAMAAKINRPKTWIVKTDMANAFATGRGPANSSVVVTTGLLKLLDLDEIRAVLAHEISHITNRDILISSIAAVIAAAISFLPDILYYRMYWSRGSNRDKDDNTWVFSLLGYLAVVILVPLVSTMLRLAISRTREFMADESGAHLSSTPMSLASALKKIEDHVKDGHVMSDKASTSEKAFSSLFFASPFNSSSFLNWFSSHPPTQERIKRLIKISNK